MKFGIVLHEMLKAWASAGMGKGTLAPSKGNKKA